MFGMSYCLFEVLKLGWPQSSTISLMGCFSIISPFPWKLSDVHGVIWVLSAALCFLALYPKE